MADPKSIEILIQEMGPDLVARLRQLTRSRNAAVALRATQELLRRGYGEVKQSERDPWDDVVDNGNVSRVMENIFRNDESGEQGKDEHDE